MHKKRKECFDMMYPYVSGYIVYFGSNEEGEPIHVHVSKGRPTPNATKIWLTRTGGCIVASNGSQIASKD